MADIASDFDGPLTGRRNHGSKGCAEGSSMPERRENGNLVHLDNDAGLRIVTMDGPARDGTFNSFEIIGREGDSFRLQMQDPDTPGNLNGWPDALVVLVLLHRASWRAKRLGGEHRVEVLNRLRSLWELVDTRRADRLAANSAAQGRVHDSMPQSGGIDGETRCPPLVAEVDESGVWGDFEMVHLYRDHGGGKLEPACWPDDWPLDITLEQMRARGVTVRQ